MRLPGKWLILPTALEKASPWSSGLSSVGRTGQTRKRGGEESVWGLHTLSHTAPSLRHLCSLRFTAWGSSEAGKGDWGLVMKGFA